MAKTTRPKFPIGTCLATVCWVEFSLSKASNNEMLTWTLQTELADGTTPKTYMRGVLTEKARWKHDEFAIACGVDPEASFAARTNPAALLRLWNNKNVKIITKPDPYIKDDIEYEGVEIAVFDSLDATVRAKLQKRRDARMAGGKVVEAAPATGAENEIPF
jgi:hypothetical protein